jgi:beta-galactosidase
MISTRLPKIWYGGDYNPDQWPEDTWREDMRLLKLAGADVATLPVFSWAKLQPDEATYDFSWLDKVMDLLAAHGIHACMATSTGAVPAWMATLHPDVLRVTIEGHKRKFGGRHNFCPNSPTFRRLAPALAGRLAERYGKHPALVAWHVNNEYGGSCYCENCERVFRDWLKHRYGTLDILNEAWNTSFWGHTFSDWSQIVLPSLLSEHLDPTRTVFQGITLDYYRFSSESLLACFTAERDALKSITPDIPVTTNLMGTFKALDYFRWAKEMDVVSWDSYPSLDTPVSDIAMRHDLMRGLKAGQPFMLMEQTPSQQNWQPYNSLKRPGVMRLQSWQAVARGADTVQFFQLKRSRGACEKYHGAFIEHAGHENTRVFREVAALGRELAGLGDTLLDSRIESRIAVLFDWENWWAVEMSSGPSVALKYVQQVGAWHEAFWSQNYSVDVVGEDQDLSRYAVVVAPVLYMLKPGVASRLAAFVERGGTFVTTFFSGIVDQNDLVTLGGYPGELRKLLGLWVEEIDALLPGQKNSIVMKKGLGTLSGSFECGMLCDLLHAEGADVLAEYGADFYSGMPCLTRNRVGTGSAWYVATAPESRFLHALAAHLAAENGIESVMRAPPGVEATRRRKGGESFLFVLNHNDTAVRIDFGSRPLTDLLRGGGVSGTVELLAKGVLVLRE